MGVYRDEHHAAIRAAAVDAISTCKPAQWQQQYSSGYVEELTKRHDDTEHLAGMDRLAQDCMTRALMHRTVSRGAFYAMVAKYGADEHERAQAVNELVSLVQVKAPDNFKRMMIWSWASVAVKRGVIGLIVEMGDQAARTLYRKRASVLEQLRAFEDAALSDLSAALQDRGLIDKSS
mgnify:CR=1 FL=1